MTLNDVTAVIMNYFYEYCNTAGASYVKMVEGRLIPSATKMYAKESSFGSM